jgi:hypothetical protein
MGKRGCFLAGGSKPAAAATATALPVATATATASGVAVAFGGATNAHLLRHLILKMIILPRQARDEHRENSPQNTRFCSEAAPAGGTLEKALAGGGCGHQFNYRTLAPLGVGKPGEPANERQWRFST